MLPKFVPVLITLAVTTSVRASTGDCDNSELKAGKITTKTGGIGSRASGSRIVGGMETQPHELPYQVAVKAVLKEGYMLCGGVVYTAEYILTAAHCAITEPGEELYVEAGVHTIDHPDKGRQSIKVTEATIHPEYITTDTLVINDIAVLKLSSPLELNRNVQTIILQQDGSSPLSDTGLASGWGCTLSSIDKCTQKGDTSEVLKKVDLTIWTNERCRQSYGRNTIKSSHICAGDDSKSPCLGDSGGPLVIKTNKGTMVLVGLTSFVAANGCGCPGIPAVFTRVSYFKTWIETIVYGKPLGSSVRKFSANNIGVAVLAINIICFLLL